MWLCNILNILFSYKVISTYHALQTIQSTKILFMRNTYSFSRFCDSNIGLFSIGPCKVIALNLLFHFSSSCCDSNSCRSFFTLKAILIHFILLFTIAFKRLKERKLKGEQYRKKSHESMYKSYQTNKATTFVIEKWEER